MYNPIKEGFSEKRCRNINEIYPLKYLIQNPKTPKPQNPMGLNSKKKFCKKNIIDIANISWLTSVVFLFSWLDVEIQFFSSDLSIKCKYI